MSGFLGSPRSTTTFLTSLGRFNLTGVRGLSTLPVMMIPPFIWRVDEGAILCNSLGRPDHDYVWLLCEREFADFELALEIQAFRESPGNSGVQVRSRYDASPEAPRGGWLDGPQIDVHPPGPWRTGLIYDETREERRWISPSLEN